MIAGVDGCKGGWLVALAEDWPGPTPPRLAFCPDFPAVLNVCTDCAAVAVDMPIGLPEADEHRVADIEARLLLPIKAKPCVFSTPPRAVLSSQSWGEFSKKHQQVAKRGANIQTWNIAQKMRELDEAMNPSRQSQFVESHPEVVWRTRLKGENLISKRKKAGRMQRLQLLQNVAMFFLEVIQKRPPQAKFDDALDALALLATAAHVAQAGVEAAPGIARRVPTLPFKDIPRDARGLRMEIWY